MPSPSGRRQLSTAAYTILGLLARNGPSTTYDKIDQIPYWHAADVFVLPTYDDPCSLVVMEAMASGLPVVASNISSKSSLAAI